MIRLPPRQRPPLWAAGYPTVSHMLEHGIWTTEGYLGAGIGLESRKETSRGKRCFKGQGSGVEGDMLHEKGRKDSGGQRTRSRGENMGARIHRSNF